MNINYMEGPGSATKVTQPILSTKRLSKFHYYRTHHTYDNEVSPRSLKASQRPYENETLTIFILRLVFLPLNIGLWCGAWCVVSPVPIHHRAGWCLRYIVLNRDHRDPVIISTGTIATIKPILLLPSKI